MHGGDLASARVRFGDPSEGWLDLSTGINPVAYPIPPLPADAWTRLPDPAALARLEAAAASAFGAADPAMVVAAPGTQALIQLLPRLIAARRVAVVGFTYQEHAASWADRGAEVVGVADPLDATAADVAVVVNPNNPDGRVVAGAELRATAAALRAHGGALVVDEAFVDLTPAASIVPELPPEGTVVLRSFGKTYGLAGVRLGFAVAAPALAAEIRRALGPWPINGPALAVATAAYGDAAWRRSAAARLERDTARLDNLLGAAGFTLIGGTLFYRLVAHPDAAGWHDQLGRAGILTRAFPQRPNWLRFGLPGDEAGWRRLEQALRPIARA